MAEASERMENGKRLSGEGSSPTDDSYYDLPPTKEFEPIAASGEGTPSRPNTLGRNRTGQSARSSISRTRTHNGYGCDDNEDSGQDVEAGVSEKDPFDVVWEGGDADPLNPRSMKLARKWLVVLIVSASSLCVYVFLFFWKDQFYSQSGVAER